ncbi:MAG TPA: DNA polymerase, partial [Ktedonobacterales bacterium]|nr:DNA polymerase [Ktedonobacterales bacterium]
MLPHIDLPRALLRGRYMCAVAAIGRNGIPIDSSSLACLRQHWPSIQRQLIAEDDTFGVYDTDNHWSNERFINVLVERDIAWPCHPDGKLDLRKETFRDMAETPGASAIAPLVRLRNGLSGLRLGIGLTVGQDDRNRTSLFAFRSTTGRNQPSSSKYIFGCARWLRGLIKPPPGMAIAYIDWKQQEFGIAAALSGDAAMLQAYSSGDPYLKFAKLSGAVPADATSKSHPTQRSLYKQCVLATQYGQGAKSLALRIARPGPNMPWEMIARDLLAAHRRTFHKFWSWNEHYIDTAMFRHEARAVFGWRASIVGEPNPRSVANFPMQANGAEMMRIACCLGIERGVEICAPVHDAFLISATIDNIDAAVVTMQEAMAEASRAVLDGFELGADAKVLRHPDRYMDDRPGSQEMWDRIWQLVRNEERKA